MKAVFFAVGAFALKASFAVALAADEVDVTPEMLVGDDTCAEGDEACHLKLLQMKADIKVAQESDAHPEGLVYDEDYHPNQAFFMELDANKDSEVQRHEVDGMLAHRIDLDEAGVAKLFQEADTDKSGGLSALEYNNAMEKWGTSCSSVHRSWFCSGTTRITCCRRGW
eukprot:CAMPEP_0206446892 /NCGR_PEP_ID=MMETSP0324_2-20121206/16431_1 /ASSEMBLY_ACC=CAM_ASM_000836 /TAXON_ID=2866 /ORGANISM="Crypthecodinium cohnii, Strain Seligo" /LENGTH=167 /DNA_ID=CAMNT_0053915499 /DNA_START=61 /DNA_END=561 /DNA_ORIENTATION=-